MANAKAGKGPLRSIPWFGARKMARALSTEIHEVRAERDHMRGQLDRLGGLTVVELDARKDNLEREIRTGEAT